MLRRLILVSALALVQPAAAQDKDLEAERRARDAERRALEADRRALEAERRGDLERRAASGGSAPGVDPCIAADVQRQRACGQGAGSPLYQAPQCTEAMSRVRQYCGR
jgi:hypothetical protein